MWVLPECPWASGSLAPSASQLLAFSPGTEQAAGVWETCLAPGWPQLRLIWMGLRVMNSSLRFISDLSLWGKGRGP